MRLATRGAAMTRLIEPVGFGPTHGHLTIHVAPKIVLKNVEWSLAEVLQVPISISWQPQPLATASFRGELAWSGVIGSGARLASTLRGWHYLVFELHEAAGNGSDGSLFLYTPELGLFAGAIGPHGDLMINENQLRKILTDYRRPAEMADEIERLLGKEWDEVLDSYRRANTIDEFASARLSM